MNIDLSPGEWAGVMTCVKEQARALRRDAETYPSVAAGEGRERADDLDRIAGIIRAALSAPPLPELVPPRDMDDDARVPAVCQHVWTETDVQAAIDRHERTQAWLREHYPEQYANRAEPSVPHLPVVGEVCGDDLLYWSGVPYMHYGEWAADGTLILGSGKSGDGDAGEDELNCGSGHYWAIPDNVDWA